MDQCIRLNAPQSRAWQKLKPGNVVTTPWGRGIGKSWFVRLVCYLLVAEWDGRRRPGAPANGVRIVILMPTLEQFRKVHLALLLNELEAADGWKHLGGVVNKTLLRIEFPGGSWIQVVSAEAAQGSRGIRCDVLVIDEADDIDPEIVESVTQPWFTEPHSLRITLIGGTPKRGRYGLLWRAHHDWPSDPELMATHFSFHATCYDAPAHVDPAYIEKVRAKTRKEVFSREYECNFDAAEGLVYSMFDPDFHVRPAKKGQTWSEILVGVDHGWEDPAVFLVVGVQGNGADATCWALEEFYESYKVQGELEAVAKKLRAKYSRWKQTWYADPSRPETIETYKRAGIPVEPALNAIEDGVASVADRFAIRTHDNPDGTTHRSARFYVDPTCVNFIRELGLYRRKRDPRNPERVLEAILDRDNHAADSARYALHTRFGGPLRQKVEQRYGHSALTR